MKFKFLGVFKRVFNWLQNRVLTTKKSRKIDRTFIVKTHGVMSFAANQLQLK